MGKRRALVTGISGQDGSYLAELLLEKDYNVWGVIRRKAVQEEELGNISHLENEPNLHLEYGDVTDSASISRIIKLANPHEVYNLAGQSQVRISFELPIYTMEVNAKGSLIVLEECRQHNKDIRFYQASTSEMFGNCRDEDGKIRETTPMIPVSPYGSAKLFAHNLVGNYRKSYGMFATSGILFNHESPRRGTAFVTQKIIRGAVEISAGTRDVLEMGSLSPARDWGHAQDYVRAMWLMLQAKQPADFVIATGKTKTVQSFVEHVFGRLKLDYRKYVKQNPKYIRPNEVQSLKGDPSKAMQILDWRPMYTFEGLIDHMLLSAVARALPSTIVEI
jgi:GDPmannose 4,6-dehydratase